MMRLSTPKEIRQRVEEIAKQLVAKWIDSHPVPDPPDAERVAREISSGRAIAVIDAIRSALTHCRFSDEMTGGDFLECVTTPLLKAHKASVHAHGEAFAKFKAELDAEKQEMLDRILFDGDAPYPLLRRFKEWKDSTQRKDEPFDGK